MTAPGPTRKPRRYTPNPGQLGGVMPNPQPPKKPAPAAVVIGYLAIALVTAVFTLGMVAIIVTLWRWITGS